MVRKVVTALVVNGRYSVACDDGSLWQVDHAGHWRKVFDGPPSDNEIAADKAKQLNNALDELKRRDEVSAETRRRLEESLAEITKRHGAS